MCACVCACVCTCVCVCVYVHVHMCVHVCVCVCAVRACSCARVLMRARVCVWRGHEGGRGQENNEDTKLEATLSDGGRKQQLIMGGWGGGKGGRHLEVTQADEGKMPHKRQQDRL